jgi:hypothetical protein
VFAIFHKNIPYEQHKAAGEKLFELINNASMQVQSLISR